MVNQPGMNKSNSTNQKKKVWSFQREKERCEWKIWQEILVIVGVFCFIYFISLHSSI